MYQCLYCGEFFHVPYELCPFCSSEALVWMDEEDESWGVKSSHSNAFVIQLCHAQAL